MTKRIGVLGTGNVGPVLAAGLDALDYSVAIGSRSGKTVDGWQGDVGTFADVAKTADIVILAVKGSVAEEVVTSVKEHINGKTVLDTTNPISDQPPQDGVINFFTSCDESLMEKLQKTAPDAHFVKAFNSVGSANMIKPQYQQGKPSMFICGNNSDAKKEASELIEQLGWEVEDMGTARAASAIEPLCILWCIPGILNNQWSHAFKLLK